MTTQNRSWLPVVSLLVPLSMLLFGTVAHGRSMLIGPTSFGPHQWNQVDGSQAAFGAGVFSGSSHANYSGILVRDYELSGIALQGVGQSLLRPGLRAGAYFEMADTKFSGRDGAADVQNTEWSLSPAAGFELSPKFVIGGSLTYTSVSAKNGSQSNGAALTNLGVYGLWHRGPGEFGGAFTTSAEQSKDGQVIAYEEGSLRLHGAWTVAPGLRLGGVLTDYFFSGLEATKEASGDRLEFAGTGEWRRGPHLVEGLLGMAPSHAKSPSTASNSNSSYWLYEAWYGHFLEAERHLGGGISILKANQSSGSRAFERTVMLVSLRGGTTF